MTFLLKIAGKIDAVSEVAGRLVSWLTLILVAVVFGDVVMRYLFNSSFVFIQELEWHLFGVIFLMGASYTLLKDGHVRVDIFYQKMGPRFRDWVNLLGTIFFLLPGCAMIIITSSGFVQSSWSVLECSPDPGGIPCRFLLKSAIPAGFFLLALQGVSLGIKSAAGIMGKEIGGEGKD
ncbi:C4-dicarboxylate ABC transporter permease [Candidatus Desulfarcum epimagneticum]|uniref:C4-dicarboxylate ABC transporter permease n=1 Tax=uncultured Desulfobacteraceae bacterium TaxID=218296 RepID=A0A484HIV5_9BACT|nr:C4-dicarboxylate ABC transporter permease [uncultured Desulfobacteraceae bacterium]